MTQVKQVGSFVLIGMENAGEAARLRTLIESWGHTVEALADGQSVLERLQASEPPAIALMDAVLPMLGGVDIAAILHERPQKLPTPLDTPAPWTIVISNACNPEQIAAATHAQVDDLITFPLDEIDLRIRLQTAARVRSLHGELTESADAARFFASHDRLTGLMNRESMIGMLFQETERAVRMQTALPLILLDLDHFSTLNLEYGYEAGDAVLQQIAGRFRRYLRTYDLVARSGADEFLVALPGCAWQTAQLTAERLRQSIVSRPFTVNAGTDVMTISLTASLGMANGCGRSPFLVLREAERALAAAKLGGRDRVCLFQPERDPLVNQPPKHKMSNPSPVAQQTTQLHAGILQGADPDKPVAERQAMRKIPASLFD